MNDSYTVVVAGSTNRTRQCLEALLADERFSISWVLTPVPKPIGRKHIVSPNPVHQRAQDDGITSILVEKKIDESIKNQILETCAEKGTPDFLLVVDFGYLIPSWLLHVPTISPLNIHPSYLPRWRGSSPGQFVLLAGEKESAVTLMVMNAALDEGAIIKQLPFVVENGWTQAEYYHRSFELMGRQLAELMSQFAQQKLKPTDQPLATSTPIARRLSKDDSFISWQVIQQAMSSEAIDPTNLNQLLQEMLLFSQTEKKLNPINIIDQAVRAFSPWPQVWTVTPTDQGEKRMKILSCHIDNNTLILDQIQIEGKQATPWKNS